MKKVVIFGGTGGLGSAVANLLKNYDIKAVGSRDVDVSNFYDVKQFFLKTPYDIIVNLSGINQDVFVHKIDEKHLDSINRQIDTNIKGNINIISNGLVSMRENNYGRIITVSSVLAEKPVVSTGVYSGCKGFIDSFVKTVAIENATKNISCNSIQLGYFDAGLTYKIPEAFRDNIRKSIPMQRWGTVQELANLILLLQFSKFLLFH